ncbi:MAG: exo-alpha-sialidase [Euryarchaeota archaeon]|nr:exo-alpha-sialidase [Euryarchaeota archaeon]
MANRGWALLLAAVIASGCLGGAERETAPDPGPTNQPAAILHVPALDPCPYGCYETTIAADPQGRTFVTEVSGTAIAVSVDGENFTRLKPPPSAAPSLDGSRGDALLAVGPDGRLWYVALTGEANGGYLRYRGIQVASSSDGGATWSTNTLVSRLQNPQAPAQFADRPWIAFGPNNLVYLSWFDAFYMNGVAPGVGGLYPGAYELFVARSDDGGKAFKTFRPAHALVPDGQGATGGAPVVDSKGRLIVPYFTFPVLAGGAASVRVAVSDDRGDTFTNRVVSPTGGSRFAALAIDSDDRLTFAWNGADPSLRLSASSDRGTTWTEPARWNPADQRMTASPWIGARPDGSLDVAWYAYNNQSGTSDLFLANGPRPTSKESLPTTTVLVEPGIAGLAYFGANTDFAHAARLPDGRLSLIWSDRVKSQAFATTFGP